ncbi:DUF402 domain-containing protein [Halovivax gelatinilyticus]|uniref:DUF402 domain-containing protein n=1 Tax=Halovivax gelatinilyticus TaxID=2961597 RepID=UPI0020CA5BC8|nr:DUF402 domain-containing protein [Halovivax gelatinilyticus]
MGERDTSQTGEDETTRRVRVRGIYATALTQLLTDDGHAVVQASDPICRRFDADFEAAPADVRIETSRDRRGIECSGEPAAVESVAETLSDLAIDAFRWPATSRGAVFDAVVRDADGGSGAVVDLGDGERGYLPYDAVDGYVDAGDTYRVCVTEPAPPWDDDRPRVEPEVAVGGGLCTLTRGASGVTAATSGERGSELVGLTDLLSAEVPDGWGLRWERSAADADIEAMGRALEGAIDRATEIDAALAEAEAPGDEPGRVYAPNSTDWHWFGRESRISLDDARRAVETTMVGHHRTKAADRSASAAVDFVEAVCGSEARDRPGDGDFPFEAVSRQFGPVAGDRLTLGHGKPDGRCITLGTGEVTEWDPDGSITLERTMSAGGRYDGLDVPKESGDVAVTKLREGRWWYPTTYKSADDDVKGTYVNVCTPVELFPKTARYVDLYVDVVRWPDGTVTVVDEDELAAAVDDGLVSEPLADKAQNVATAVERALQ